MSLERDILATEDVSVRRGPRRAVDRVSCAFAPGTWTAIVGANGAGKSTLLGALAGLIAHESGTVLLGDAPIESLRPRERARRIGWLAQGAAAPDHLTVRECVALGRFPYSGWLDAASASDRAAIDAALRASEITALADRRMSTLSGGERQRALIARVLATGAPILLLDEPTTFLDPPHQEQMARMMRRLAHEEGRTVVCAIHDLSLALAADRILVLEQGRVVGAGSIDAAIAGDWLGRAFGAPLAVVEAGGQRLWRPNVGEPR